MKNLSRILLSALTALVFATAFADNEDTFTFKNETGKDVNDLHIEWTRAVKVKSVTVFKKTSNSGTSKSDFSKGDVKAKDSVDVTVTWDGTDPKVKSWYWTLDGEKVRDERVSSVCSMAGFVTPSQLLSMTPFSFTAGGMVEGQVVSIQNVEGEVVAQARTNDKGLAYLATGLAAGVYSLVTESGSSRPVNVQPCPPGLLPNSPLSLGSINPIKLGDMVHLSGSGINPNAAMLDASFQGAKQIPLDVKAATPYEMVLGSPKSAGLKPGDMGKIQITDKQAGTTASCPTMVYDARAELSQRTIPGGSETHLMIFVEPRSLAANVDAEVLSGPVSFANGQRTQTMPVKDGKADFAIRSRPGSNGLFNVNWNIDFSGGFANLLAQDKGLKDHWNADRTTWTQTDEKGRLVHEVKFDKDGNCIQDIRWEYDENGYMIKKVTIKWNKDGTVTERTQTWDEKHNKTGDTSETRDKDGKVIKK